MERGSPQDSISSSLEQSKLSSVTPQFLSSLSMEKRARYEFRIKLRLIIICCTTEKKKLINITFYSNYLHFMRADQLMILQLQYLQLFFKTMKNCRYRRADILSSIIDRCGESKRTAKTSTNCNLSCI